MSLTCYAVLAALSGRAALLLWLVTAVLVPFWLFIPLPFTQAYNPIIEIVSLLTLAAFLLHGGRLNLPRWTLAFFALIFLGGLLGSGMPDYYFRTVLLSWFVPTCLGQVAYQHLPSAFLLRALQVTCITLAGLAIGEFLLGWHPFVDVRGPVEIMNGWAEIQLRSGLARSEGAFGHSIALGGAIVLLAPFAVGQRRGGQLHFFYALVVGMGVLATISRAAGLGILVVVSLLILRDSGKDPRGRRQRVGALMALLCCVPLFVGLLRGASDLESSTSVRAEAFETLSREVLLIGTSPSFDFGARANTAARYGDYQSIDNHYLLMSLNAGLLIAAAFLLVFVLYPVITIARRRAGPAHVAVLGTGLMIWSVALITQWQSLVFFVLGLAIGFQQESATGPSPKATTRGSTPRPPQTPPPTRDLRCD